MKVVKWGVHGTGTCIGPGILLGRSLIIRSRGKIICAVFRNRFGAVTSYRAWSVEQKTEEEGNRCLLREQVEAFSFRYRFVCRSKKVGVLDLGSYKSDGTYIACKDTWRSS